MSTNAAPILDPAQLRRRTMGDADMQVEVLSLFVTEVERLLRQIEDAEDAQVRGERLRALIVAARDIGATRLAQAARLIETEIAPESPDLTPLRGAVTETLAYIHRTGA